MIDNGGAVRDRLRVVAKARGVNTDFLLNRWVVERFLHRLSFSPRRQRLTLKGAHLFTVWEGDLHRSTTDLDFHSSDGTSPDLIAGVLVEIARQPVPIPDGVTFLPTDARSRLQVRGKLPALRMSIPASMGRAEILLRVDVGFGPPPHPGVEERWYPSLLPGMGATPVLCCPRETVIAEKLAIAVEFGADNSRLRDYYDLWFLSERYAFVGHSLMEALERVFTNRDAGVFVARNDGYWEGAFGNRFAATAGERCWREWLDGHASHVRCPSLLETARAVGHFAIPMLTALRDGRRLSARWMPSLGWQPEHSSTRAAAPWDAIGADDADPSR